MTTEKTMVVALTQLELAALLHATGQYLLAIDLQKATTSSALIEARIKLSQALRVLDEAEGNR
jgi:hypothetical protein